MEEENGSNDQGTKLIRNTRWNGRSTRISTSTTPLDQLQDEWKFRNNSTYNQLLLCISLELQTKIEDTERASEAWKILVDRFESTDLSKVSIVRTRYETYHMTEDQRVMSYITPIKKYRN